jgi:membrane associated rhomboid family serine protease
MLLFLPYRDRPIQQDLPVATLLIALLCVAVTLALHPGDAATEREAYAFYRDSGLAAVELPRYHSYLAARVDSDSTERLHRFGQAAPGSEAAIRLLQEDANFQKLLHARRIVAADDPQFEAWSQAREHFDALVESTAAERLSLRRADAAQLWRFVTHTFLQDSVAALLGNVLVLILIGPFVESALGWARFLACYLAAGAAAGALQIVTSDAAVLGASGAVAAVAGMSTVLFGTERVRVFYWFFFLSGTGRMPPLALLPVWLLVIALQWWSKGGASAVEYGAIAGGFCAGVLAAWLARPRAQAPVRAARAGPAAAAQDGAHAALAAQARDAASRLEGTRATRLFRDLVELEPGRVDYQSAYLNAALLGTDEEALRDAALRLLWNRFRKPTDELRKIFLQMTQDKVIQVLPVDERLRLARRLVKIREDAAALRVIDDLLRVESMRQNFGRQLADCLLGIYTAYSRSGLQRQADQINTRLATYFPTGSAIGGEAPANRPPPTIVDMFRNTAPAFTSPPTQTGDRPARPPTLPGSRER